MKKNEMINMKKVDPLSRLDKINEDTPFEEREALLLITSILKDLENDNIIRITLRDIIINDEVPGLNILNPLGKLIQGLKKVHISRINRAWNRRFITALETVHI